MKGMQHQPVFKLYPVRIPVEPPLFSRQGSSCEAPPTEVLAANTSGMVIDYTTFGGVLMELNTVCSVFPPKIWRGKLLQHQRTQRFQ